MAQNGVYTGWLRYQFPSAKVVQRYEMSVNAHPRGTALDWTFEGSNNGSTWTTLGTESGVYFRAYEKKSFAAVNSTAYAYYRVNISASVHYSTWFGIADLLMYCY